MPAKEAEGIVNQCAADQSQARAGRQSRPGQARPAQAEESESVTRSRHRIAMAHTHFRFLLLNYVIIERNAIKRR